MDRLNRAQNRMETQVKTGQEASKHGVSWALDFIRAKYSGLYKSEQALQMAFRNMLKSGLEPNCQVVDAGAQPRCDVSSSLASQYERHRKQSHNQKVTQSTLNSRNRFSDTLLGIPTTSQGTTPADTLADLQSIWEQPNASLCYPSKNHRPNTTSSCERLVSTSQSRA